MANLLIHFIRSLTGRCLECGSKNRSLKVKVIDSHVESENFPKGMYYTDWKVETVERTRYCMDCGYQEYLGKSTDRRRL